MTTPGYGKAVPVEQGCIQYFVLISILSIMVLSITIPFDNQRDEANAEQAILEALLIQSQIAHIEQMQSEFEKAVIGTLFVTKNGFLGLVTKLDGNTLSFVSHLNQTNGHVALWTEKKFLFFVTQIAHPGTKEYEALWLRFLTQSSQNI